MADDNIFNFEKYNVPTIKGGKKEQLTSYVDGTDALANQGFQISFFHLPSQKSVSFKAFITAFNETYASDWAAETVYGRADPIYMFKNTQRKVTLAFKVPAGSAGEAYENLGRVQQLLQFLYPSYTDVSNANTISQSPLVRLKVMNLLSNEGSDISAEEGLNLLAAESPQSLFDSYESTSAPDTGLLGVIGNVTVNHNIDNPDHGAIEKATGTILPKMIEINLDFSPIHEHTVGWIANNEGKADFANQGFPYMAPLSDGEAAKVNADAGAANWSPDTPSSFLSDAQKAAEATEDTAAAQQAAEEAAEARYSGLMGSIREWADEKDDTRSEYQTQALAGAGNEKAQEDYEHGKWDVDE